MLNNTWRRHEPAPKLCSKGAAWCAILVSLAAGSVRGQATSFSTALQPLIVTTVTLGTRTQAPGPLPTDFPLLAPGLGESAQIYVGQYPAAALPPGGQAWRVVSELHMDITHQFAMVRACSLSGRVRLHFSSPTPVSGVLYLMPEFYHYGPFQSFSGDMTVDLDGNGVPDYAASTRSWRSVEKAVTLDAAGVDIDFDMVMAAYWNAVGPGTIRGNAVAKWEVAFLPNTYGLETRQLGCTPLTFGRSTASLFRVGLGCSPVNQSSPRIAAGIFLLGFAEQSNPLPIPPYCNLFVDNPAVVMPTVQSIDGIALWPPEVPLPPGLTFYCQGAWLDTQNQIITSDSVRTL